MKVKDPGALRGGKGRVCITAHIGWKFGRVLVSRSPPSRFIRSNFNILCVGFFLYFSGGGSYSRVNFL